MATIQVEINKYMPKQASNGHEHSFGLGVDIRNESFKLRVLSLKRTHLSKSTQYYRNLIEIVLSIAILHI